MVDNNKKTLLSTVYNTYGTMIYYFMQWVTTVLVVRILGYDENGVFSLCISFTNVFGFISRFGERSVQLTDVDDEFSEKQYFGVRILATAFSVVCMLVALLFVSFDKHTLICCIAYGIFKVFESFTDYFFTIMQKKERYSAIAVSYTLKSFFPLAGFVFGIWLSGLMMGIVFMSVVYFAVFVYDYYVIYRQNRPSISFNNITPIIKKCIPIMLYSLILPYMTFINRYFVKLVYDEEQLGYYSTISIVLVIMSTIAGSIWVVLLPRLTKMYNDKENKKIAKFLFVISGSVIIVSGIAVLLGELLGPWAFSLIFGEEIRSYMYLLSSTLIASACLVFSSLFSTVLMFMKKRIKMLIYNAVGAVALTIIIKPFVERFGLLGSNYALIISFALQTVLLITSSVVGLIKNRKAK